jgi:glutamate-ammonia-ligase adenylyltransferase
VSLKGFADYQRNEAWTWEHMALCRSRPVRGSAERREQLRTVIHDVLATPHDPAKVRVDAARMRFEMRRHKPPSGALDIKLGPGGLVDLEFAIHTLQLASGSSRSWSGRLRRLRKQDWSMPDWRAICACSRGCWSCFGW